MPVIIAITERLVIRQLEPADASFMLAIVNSPGWLKYIGDRNVHSVEDAIAYLENGAIASYRLHGFGLWMMEKKDTAEAAGLCGLIRRPGLNDVDLGFALLPEFQGKGFAYEAVQACISQARLLQLPRLVAITTPDNNASIGLLIKTGFELHDRVTLPGSNEILNLYLLRPEQ